MQTSAPSTKDYLQLDPRNLGLLVFTCVEVAVLLFAAHAAAVEHSLFYVADGLAAAFVIAYATLQWKGIVNARSLVPACLILAWLLSLLISLSAPSRQRQLLGLGEGDVYEACEEGSIVLWLVLGLTSITVLVPMPFGVLAVFGQFISLQHLILGLALARPECSEDTVPRGGPGGFLLGLPPIWASALQLHAIAGLLSIRRYSAGSQFQVQAREFVLQTALRREDSKVLTPQSCRGEEYGGSQNNDIVVQNWIERLVQELCVEEECCRQFLDEYMQEDESEWSESRAWQAIVESLLNVLAGCEQTLKKHVYTTDQRWRQDLVEAIADSTNDPGSAVGKDVSGWLMESFIAADQQFTKTEASPSELKFYSEDGSEAMDDITSLPTPRSEARHYLKLHTTPGLRTDLHISEWSFDALKVERDQTHVLQVLGFELLRPFSPTLMPRGALRNFLEQLEDAYVSTNAYHSHIHGADMCNAFFFLTVNTDLWSLGELPDSSKVAMLIAALGHDVGHFARNNAFLISSRHPLALRYNDRSVLENFHSATLMHILAGTGPDGTGDYQRDSAQTLLTGLPAEQLRKARQLMITLILSTDTQKHLEDLAAFRLRLGHVSFNPLTNAEDQQQSLCMLFRIADISHSAKNWVMHEEWSRRCVQEFHEQGDEEKRLGLKVSPLCDRDDFVLHTAQVGFLQFVCLPSWREIVRMEAMKVLACPATPASPATPATGGGSPQRQNRKPRTQPSLNRANIAEMIKRQSTRVGGLQAYDSESPLTSRTPDVSPKKQSWPQSAHQLDQTWPSNGKAKPAWANPASAGVVVPMPGENTCTSMEPNNSFMLEEGEPPKMLIAECCLVLCEKNLQAWKNQGETDTPNNNNNNKNSTKDVQSLHVPPSMPIRHATPTKSL